MPVTSKKGARPRGPNKNNPVNKKGGIKKLPPAECRSYAALRVALDSFQAMALVYYAAGKTSSERNKRVGEIRDAVKKAVKPWTSHAQSLKGAKKAAKKAAASPLGPGAQPMLAYYGNGCYPGYQDCNGFCIPEGQPCW
jgi:hypothetical protein